LFWLAAHWLAAHWLAAHFDCPFTHCPFTEIDAMNSDTLTQLLKKGFRVTLGATATLVEALQDPQRREASFSKLATDLSQLTEEWETKGVITEQEARNFVDTLWQQQNPPSAPPPQAQAGPFPTPPSSLTVPASEVQQDLQELTAQIAAIRAEIEKLRDQNNP
jgi:polyhydroxyalkanoate synthesis regulator phasin